MPTRRILLFLGVLTVVGIGGYLANRWGYFARDAEDTQAIAELGGKKLDAPPPADASVGWFQWRGPTRDGRPPTGPFRSDWDKTPPKLLWKADCGGGFSSCSVVVGKLYTQDRPGGDRERVFCLNAETGEKLWEHTYPASYAGLDYGAGPRATPTVLGNRVFTVGALGKFLCLEPPAGGKGEPRVVWEHDLLSEFGASPPRWGVACSPLVEGDLVIVQPGGKDGSVVAFEKESGAVRWKAGSNPSGYSSPIAATIGGQRLVFAFTGDALLAIRAGDGKVLDSYPWKTEYNGNIATPVVVDEYVFISSAYSHGSALLKVEVKGDGVRLAQVYARLGRAFQTHHSTAVFKDRYLFGYTGMLDSARLKCVAFDTGKEKDDWDATGMGTGSGTIVLTEKHLIIQTQKGDLALVEATPEEFRLVVKLPRVLSGNNNWATPTLLDGRLYLRDDQKVLCYDVRP